MYDRLFKVAQPSGQEFEETLNPESLIVKHGFVEPSLANPQSVPYQFEREGYFFRDSHDSHENKLVFNRTVALRDSWSD